MRAGFAKRPTTGLNGRGPSRGGGSAPNRAVAAALLCPVLVCAVVALLAGVAEARLSIIPGRPSTPRPTPQVTSSKTACQERVRTASAELAAGVRAAFAECLRVGLPCIFDHGGSASCCASATPSCVRQAEEIAAAGAAFVADVVAPACSTVSFADLIGEDGLDFGRTSAACLRLDPPIAVDGLGSLATCLERLVTQDVLHLAANIEQPRALEALVCMDVETRFPGVLRDRPATCEDLPAATPSPSPTPVATPTASAGGTPTPGGSPGAPTPTPAPTPGAGSPTPVATRTPGGGSTCTQIDVTVAVNFSATDFADVAGVTVGLGYPSTLSIPGFGNEATVLARVTNLTGVQGGLFSVGDQDTQFLLNVGLISTGSPIPPGGFARARFDCGQGSSAPPASAFTCVVDASTLAGNTVDPTQCVVTVATP